MKHNQFLLITLFLTYIFGFFILGFVVPSKEFSSSENRKLEQMPTFSIESLLSGEFGEKYETYLADQFPFRDAWISIKSLTDKYMGKKEQNGVFIGKDDYFLQNIKQPDLELAKKNADYLNELGRNYHVNVMLVPTSTAILKEKLPLFAQPYDEKIFLSFINDELSSDINTIDIYNTLRKHNSEYIYYKTDHHWTTKGAYYAYIDYCKAMGLTPANFSEELVSDSFLGTLYSKGNFSFATPDDITLYHPTQPTKLTVNYVNINKQTTTLYERNNLKEKDQYSMFLDGNHPYITITTSIKNGKKLAVVKDSFANSFIPFLTQHYEEIIVLDFRFINTPLSSFLNENDIKDILLLYNTQNFATERKFSLLR